MGLPPPNKLVAWIPNGLMGEHSLMNAGTVKHYNLSGLDVKALILDLIGQDATQILVRFNGKLFTATPTTDGYERKEVIRHKLLWYLEIGDTVDILAEWNLAPEPEAKSSHAKSSPKKVSKQLEKLI